MSASPKIIAGVLVLSLAANLAAHGGQYRGPWGGRGFPSAPPGGGPKAPGAPTPAPVTPRPALPAFVPTPPSGGTAVPVTGGLDASPEATWETWWEFNKDPYLQVGSAADKAPATGSDDFYLGAPRRAAVIDVRAPSVADLTERVVPALAGLLAKERNRDVDTSCLVSLGKVGRDAIGTELHETIAAHVGDDDQEVRETAVLALGIAGRPKSLGVLTAIVNDDKEGRRLSGGVKVRERTRAFAAYALGLLARRSTDAAVKQNVHDVLWALLQDEELKDRDIRTAAVNGLGLLGCDVASGAQKRLQWQTVDELMAWYLKDLGATDEVVQAQAPIAVMRLLRRGSTALHQKCKAQFASSLGIKEHRGNAIVQSAAIALGDLLEPEEKNGDDAPFARALQQYYERGRDRQARLFAVLALGRIGGAANRTFLLSAYQHSNKGSERPWVALALGLLAEPAARAGNPDSTIAEVLLDDLRGINNDQVRGAIAIAVGLVGHSSAGPVAMEMLRDREGDEHMAGHLCICLALLGEQAAVPQISSILDRSARRPFLLQQAAVALGHLGDRDTTLRLLRAMKATDSTAVLSALAGAIGQIGDGRSIDPLIAMMADTSLTKLGRAFCASALGGVGDKDSLPWNVPLAIDCNYAAGVDTLTNGATGVLDIL